jgi:hypothetical protein
MLHNIAWDRAWHERVAVYNGAGPCIHTLVVILWSILLAPLFGIYARVRAIFRVAGNLMATDDDDLIRPWLHLGFISSGQLHLCRVLDCSSRSTRNVQVLKNLQTVKIVVPDPELAYQGSSKNAIRIT